MIYSDYNKIPASKDPSNTVKLTFQIKFDIPNISLCSESVIFILDTVSISSSKIKQIKLQSAFDNVNMKPATILTKTHIPN